MNKKFMAYFWFVGWDCISFGLHVSFASPNVELHVPFGFFRIGWVRRFSDRPVRVQFSRIGNCSGFGLID